MGLAAGFYLRREVCGICTTPAFASATLAISKCSIEACSSRSETPSS